MESIIRQIIVFLGISVCVGYFCEFIVRESEISYSSIENIAPKSSTEKQENKIVVIDIAC